MNRTLGIAIAAVVLSVTLGVLVGLLIHTSMVQRADRPVTTPGSTSATDETSTSAEPIVVRPPAPSGSSASPGTGTDGVANPTHSTSTTAETTVITGSMPSSPDVAPTTPIDGSLPDPSSEPRLPSPPVTTSLTTPTANTVTTSPGGDQANERCPALGDKTSSLDGTSLFCQHDPSDRALRWRAVVGGGGCLNQSMTGTGTDGRQYACTLGEDGLNHWVVSAR